MKHKTIIIFQIWCNIGMVPSAWASQVLFISNQSHKPIGRKTKFRGIELSGKHSVNYMHLSWHSVPGVQKYSKSLITGDSISYPVYPQYRHSSISTERILQYTLASLRILVDGFIDNTKQYLVTRVSYNHIYIFLINHFNILTTIYLALLRWVLDAVSSDATNDSGISSLNKRLPRIYDVDAVPIITFFSVETFNFAVARAVNQACESLDTKIINNWAYYSAARWCVWRLTL